MFVDFLCDCVYVLFQRFHFDEDDEEEGGTSSQDEIEVFPATHCDRYMMRLVDFKLKTQANLAEEGLGQKLTNVRFLDVDCLPWKN